MSVQNAVVARSEFIQDRPFERDEADISAYPTPKIAGVELIALVPMADQRGRLVELLTQRDERHEEIVHVYQVFAEEGSVRAWVYHEKQTDRLAFNNGNFRVVLYDIRENSPTYGVLDVLNVGIALPCRIHLPPYIVHGVLNAGPGEASFTNMPNRPYMPHDPDKRRIPHPDPRIPYAFD